MSLTNNPSRKMCEKCLKHVNIYITCFRCDAIYHIYCWKKVSGAYVNEGGQLFCCPSLTSNYASTQDNPPERVQEKGNADGHNKDMENCLIKKEESEWNEFKCDTCLLEFTNKERFENHYCKCSNKEGETIQELNEDKDFENFLIKEEDFEWNKFKCDTCPLEFTNKEHLENHYYDCSNKKGETIQELNEDKDLESCLIKKEESEWNEFKCDTCLLEFTNNEHLENHYRQCANKEGETIQMINDKDLENSLHKEEDLKCNEFQCNACLLEFLNEEHCENHDSGCPNKQRKSIRELIEDKGLKNQLAEAENSKLNEFKCDTRSFEFMNTEPLENHCGERPNKQEGAVQGLNKDKAGLSYSFCKEENVQKRSYEEHIRQSHIESSYSQSNKDNDISITNTKRDPAEVDGKKIKYNRTICTYSIHVKERVVKRLRINNSERSFKCDLCDYAAKEREALRSHFSSKHYNGKERYDSRVCASSTPSVDAFGSHQLIHTSERQFKCNWRDYTAAQKITLKDHITSKYSNADKAYRCKFCKYSTYSKEHLLSHIRTHTIIHVKGFKCHMCDYIAAWKLDLDVHIKVKHCNIDKKYKCKACEYSTHRKELLVKHILTHTNEKPFKCNMCDYAAAVKDSLNMHVLVIHSNADKAYRCKYCEYSTYSRENLLSHIRTHTIIQVKAFKCDMCDYIAAWKLDLDVHMKIKHCNADKKYKCRACEYSTQRKELLVKHILTHTNEKPFKCDMCDYSAVVKDSLNMHVLVKHSNAEKMYKCGRCQYSTHIKRSLLVHERTHTKERPFKCDICNYAAIQKLGLKVHILTKHSNGEKRN